MKISQRPTSNCKAKDQIATRRPRGVITATMSAAMTISAMTKWKKIGLITQSPHAGLTAWKSGD
jgi:hypothetical protein